MEALVEKLLDRRISVQLYFTEKCATVQSNHCFYSESECYLCSTQLDPPLVPEP